jgi:ADP-heptose:LPS heptosyltransferase
MSAVLDVTPQKQLSILIVQLGEIEEVFRSLMAVKAVKHLYPQMKFHFIVRPEHSAPLHRVDWIDTIHEIPHLDVDNSMKMIAQWVDQVLVQNYDLLANWTFSKRYQRMSSIVTTLIPAAVKFGSHVRNDFSVASYDAWSIYRDSWLRDQTIDQDIHHTDIITTQLLTALQIHAGEPQPESNTGVVTSRNFFKVPSTDLLPKTISKWIAVHPDSLDLRFEEVIEMILRRHPDCGVVLLNDQPLIDSGEIFVGNPRIINLSGTLNFDSLVSVLSNCSWLIAGRAPIVDLANLLNIRTIYWIEAQPQITGEATYKWTESGPYGNGNIAIRFREDFQPEIVYAVWSHYQSEWFHKGNTTLEKHFENLSLSSISEGVEIYRSKIRNPQEGGGVLYEMVMNHETSFEEWMFRLRGQVARAWFCGWVPPVEDEVSKLNLNPTLIKRAREIGESLKVIDQLTVEGKVTSKGLSNSLSKIKNHKIMSVEDRDMIEAFGRKLLELEGFLSRVVQVEPELKCFFVWYQHLMHNLSGETLDQMAKETFQAFELVSEGAELIQVYVEKVLARAKPKSISISEHVAPLNKN